MGKTKLVVVGGGAGGLELVSRLCRSRRLRQLFDVTLVDRDLTHIWKPLWHELIAGTFSPQDNEINYLHHAYANGYRFEPGELLSLDRQAKNITVSSIPGDYGELQIGERQIGYDLLVLAMGSISHDLGITGVDQHCLYLDSIEQCHHIQKRILSCLLWHQYHPDEERVSHIALIGGGATGVELAAELDDAIQQLHQLSYKQLPKQQIQLHLIEAADQLLPALPADIGEAARKQLLNRGINVHIGYKVHAVTDTDIQTTEGQSIPAAIKIWTAGIKAPNVMNQLDGLNVNKLGQLIINSRLQATQDPDIFALGDCASCPQPHLEKPAPPRAQTANQQAKFLAHALPKYIRNETLPHFYYRDYGSLITLSRMKTIGFLRATQRQSGFRLEGYLARFFYWGLHKKHQALILGYWPVIWQIVGNLFKRHDKRPNLKLH